MDTATVKLLANVTELVVRDIEANVLSKSVRATSDCLPSGGLLIGPDIKRATVAPALLVPKLGLCSIRQSAQQPVCGCLSQLQLGTRCKGKQLDRAQPAVLDIGCSITAATPALQLGSTQTAAPGGHPQPTMGGLQMLVVQHLKRCMSKQFNFPI